MTGWPGFLVRGASSCGVSYGANCSSPIFEYAQRAERFLFIREDVDIMEGSSKVPMAVYRRSDRQVKTGPTVKTPAITVRIIENRKRKTYMSIYVPLRKNKKPRLDFPGSGIPYELIIEVRKDGTPHPHAWARLPKIGRF
jgi:hypothetical protein